MLIEELNWAYLKPVRIASVFEIHVNEYNRDSIRCDSFGHPIGLKIKIVMDGKTFVGIVPIEVNETP